MLLPVSGVVQANVKQIEPSTEKFGTLKHPVPVVTLVTPSSAAGYVIPKV